MKKIRVNGELALFIALIFLAIGIVFVIKADFGMTVVQAPVYVLSLALPSISIGTWNYIVQGGLFLLMIVIIRNFKIRYLVSFISGILYGFILDFFIWLMRDLTANTLAMNILFYILGFIFLCIAVALFFSCKAPLMPYDIFIREVAHAKGIKLAKFKWFFDISCLATAVILSLTLKKSLIGIGIGTIIFAFLVSPAMAQIIKLFDKVFLFEPYFKDSKVNPKNIQN